MLTRFLLLALLLAAAPAVAAPITYVEDIRYVLLTFPAHCGDYYCGEERQLNADSRVWYSGLRGNGMFATLSSELGDDYILIHGTGECAATECVYNYGAESVSAVSFMVDAPYRFTLFTVDVDRPLGHADARFLTYDDKPVPLDATLLPGTRYVLFGRARATGAEHSRVIYEARLTLIPAPEPGAAALVAAGLAALTRRRAPLA